MLPSTATIDSYGGLKADYGPVEDVSTDLEAAHGNDWAADTAAMTHTASRVWRRFLGHATTPADPASAVHDAVWGDTNAVKPTVAHSSTGVYILTTPTTATDALGVTRTITLRWAKAYFEGSTAYVVNATVTGANQVTVRVWNTSFALNDAVGVTFLVEAG